MTAAVAASWKFANLNRKQTRVTGSIALTRHHALIADWYNLEQYPSNIYDKVLSGDLWKNYLNLKKLPKFFGYDKKLKCRVRELGTHAGQDFKPDERRNRTITETRAAHLYLRLVEGG